MFFSEREDMVRNIIFFAVGAALAGLSFFFFLYPQSRSWPVIILLCVLDFCYTAVNAFMLTDKESEGRVLKTAVILLIYFVLFNIAPMLYLLFNEKFAVYTGLWQDILMYSIFCGPLLIVVILVVSIALILIGIANGHGIR